MVPPSKETCRSWISTDLQIAFTVPAGTAKPSALQSFGKACAIKALLVLKATHLLFLNTLNSLRLIELKYIVHDHKLT